MKVKLSEVIQSLESGGRPKGGAMRDGGIGIPSIGAEHLDSNGGFNFKSVKHVPTEFFEKLNSGIIESENILVVKDGATTGKVSFVSANFPFKKSAVNEHVFVLKIDKSKASPKYVFQYLRTQQGQRNILKDFRGATVGGISRGFIDFVSFPLPTLSDQIQIANLLSKAENLIAQRKESISMLDVFLKSTFLEMFGDPAFNSKNWDKIKFRELIAKGDKINYGIVQPGEDGNKVGIAIIRVGDFDGIRINSKNLKLVDPIIEQKHKTSRLVGDEVLIACVGATIGKIALADISHAGKNIVRAIARVRCDTKKLNRLFLCQLLLTAYYQFNLKNLARTIAQPTLNIGQIEELKITVPPIELQNRFAKIVKKTEALKTQYRQSLQELENLYGSLSQQAFKGKLEFSKEVARAE